jgi:hypothetical protein
MKIRPGHDPEIMEIHRSRRYALLQGVPFLVAGAVAMTGSVTTWIKSPGFRVYSCILMLIGLPCLWLGVSRVMWTGGVVIDRRRGQVRSWSGRQQAETPLEQLHRVAAVRYWHFGKQQQDHLYRVVLQSDDEDVQDVVCGDRLREDAARAACDEIGTFLSLPVVEVKGRAATL